MHLKTFRAPTMAEALSQLKRELGGDAVIIHTRSFRVGSVLGLGGRTVVEITASSGEPKAPAERPSKSSAAVPSLTRHDDSLHRSRERIVAGLRPSIVTPAASPPAPPQPVPAAPVVPPSLPSPPAPVGGDLEAQLEAIRKLVGQVLQCSRQTQVFVARQSPEQDLAKSGRPALPPGSMPDALFQQYLSLIESEVAGDIADEVVARVRDELIGKDAADVAMVRQSVVRHLAAMMPSDPDVARPVRPRDGRPLTIALIGPTGVGKTTTIAKLAATYKLRFGKKIRLITSDTYRIAAVDQLRTYAQIIGVPIDVALTPADMQAAARNAGPDDVVLIDTAGRSPRDAAKVDELARFIEATRPHYTHLVMSGTASPQSMIEAAQRFAAAKPNRVIFSKLDEAVNFGVLVGVARKIDLKLSFFTTGQEVPDHIELAKPDRLAKLIVEGATSVNQAPSPALAGAAR